MGCGLVGGNWVREARSQAGGAPTGKERAEIRECVPSWSG